MPSNPVKTEQVEGGEQSLSAFVADQGITADVEWADSNPNASDDWAQTARHFVVTLKRGDRTMAVPFSQGSAHTDEPTAEDVLDCLASDASSVADEPDWLVWARDMGFESIEDAEKARATYQTIERQSAELADFLGAEEFQALLYGTERL